MPLQPLEDRVVIRPVATEKQTPGGIVLPDIAQEKPQRGEVLAVGPGRTLPNGQVVPVAIAVGDVVLFNRHIGIEAKQDGIDVKIMREGEVLAKLDDSVTNSFAGMDKYLDRV